LGVKRISAGPRASAIAALSAWLLCLAAIAPHGAAASAAVPLIIDTDIFTNADDVGALASAFALQLRGETNVIAVAVNTPTSRPTVATDSWKCVAAIDSFYGSPDIPIGTHMPNNAPPANSPYVAPCAQLAPASTPAPDSAVNVYRRALAAQPDGSVVVACIGYLGNLADLLRSPPDTITPLNGRELVAQKARTLVVMGGGYPSRAWETNLAGDPAAAQYVSDNWPTKIAWSGYEVGDAVRTGNTITSTHPANSPIRVAYEAYAGANNPIRSYDLTAVYHAVRPTDPLLSETGPGKNTIDNTGGNLFNTNQGNQYYLTLPDATALDRSIEALLKTLPPGQIRGTVVDASTKQAIAGAAVQAYDSTGRLVASTQTASDGKYTLSALAAGSYKLRFIPAGNHLPQFYNGKSTLATADPVSVTAASTSTGVNAALAVAAPSDTATPTISGSAQPGQTPTESPGSLTNGPDARVSSATIRALLVKALTAHGNGARIGALLKRGGYTFSFAAPAPGRLVIAWYHASKHARNALVASLTVVFHKRTTARLKLVLTGNGRKLLNSATNFKLTARGSFTPSSQGTTSATKSLTLITA
jgi:inosine-uridine nucleoside N-ribohydrolase